ncbi:MAG: zinc/iron-chelating domain-containing protein [Desulfobacteraceae bacterium 4572_130]|nr:MAG: zinc/iron-chelating domain-containing protein [Desulfobacteraceae bacterium 4572_130]
MLIKNSNNIFECQQCGKCCFGFGGTYVTKKDINKIAEYLNITPGSFINQFCDKSGTKNILTQKKNGFCIFFDKNCTIHPVKPYMCKAWPFLKTILKNPENWDAMANSCKGMKKQIPHKILKQIVLMEIQKLMA